MLYSDSIAKMQKTLGPVAYLEVFFNKQYSSSEINGILKNIKTHGGFLDWDALSLSIQNNYNIKVLRKNEIDKTDKTRVINSYLTNNPSQKYISVVIVKMINPGFPINELVHRDQYEQVENQFEGREDVLGVSETIYTNKDLIFDYIKNNGWIMVSYAKIVKNPPKVTPDGPGGKPPDSPTIQPLPNVSVDDVIASAEKENLKTGFNFQSLLSNPTLLVGIAAAIILLIIIMKKR